MRPTVKKILRWTLLIVTSLVVAWLVWFSVWRIRLAHNIKSEVAAIRATGLPTNCEENNTYYPSVPTDENAALKMMAAFELMINYDDARSNQISTIKFPQRKESLAPSELESLIGYCEMNSKALAKASEASKLLRSRYPVDLSLGAHASLKHLAKFKPFTELTEYDTIINPSNAATDISILIVTARSLDDEPILISKLIRVRTLNMAVMALEHRLNAASLDDMDLDRLEKLFGAAAKTNQMAHAFIGDRATFLGIFQMVPDEIARLADSDDELAKEKPVSSPGFSYRFGKFAGVFDLDERFYLKAITTYIVLASKYPRNMSVLDEVDGKVRQTLLDKRFIISKLLLSPDDKPTAYRAAIIKEATSLAQIRAARVALAIERFRLAHGKLPEKLDELIPQFLPAVPADPFDGQPLRYHRLEKGCVIYSIGSDGEDNGGRERPANVKSTDKTHYDITFTVER